MKLFFTKDDTLYKIMKSLEKVTRGKHVLLYIDHQNAFFSHPWWGKQVASLLTEKGVEYTCICKHTKTKKYFEDQQMPYEYDAPNRILYAMHLFGMLLFNVKKFHLSVFTKKNTLSYVFIAGEILGIGAIIYIMYQFLVPSATILIQPAYNVEDVVYNFRYYAADQGHGGSTGLVSMDTTGAQSNYITIPYHIGAMDYTQTLSLPIQSLEYLSNPSAGKIVIYNSLNTKFTLKEATQFITDNGLVFRAKYPFVLPPGTQQSPSAMLIEVVADDKDKDGKIVGENGNILSGTRLLIRNLNQSSVLGAVYAYASGDFIGGYTRSGNVLSERDIDLLKDKLTSFVTGSNMKVLIKKEFHNEDEFLLPMDSLMSMENIRYDINAKSGDFVENLEGKMTVTFRYPYVIWQDLMQGVDHYVDQRPSQTRQLISLQKNTATFYKTYMMENYIVIPTKVSAVWGYDFDLDVSHIKDAIRERIAGMSVDEAKKEILTYPDISATIIKDSPAWANTIPTLKSRIYFRTTMVQE